MKSRLISMRQYHSCRVSKAARYSRVTFHSHTVLSRRNSMASNFGNAFRGLPNQRSSSGGAIFEEGSKAFRNYNVPITPDLQVHLSQCTLPDSQPTNSALLMLDGSTSSNQTLPALPGPELPIQNCSFCGQPTKFRESGHQLNCGHVWHAKCLSIQWPSYSMLEHCPTCKAVSTLHLELSIDPSRRLDPKITFIGHRSLIYAQGNSRLLQGVNTTIMPPLNVSVP